MDYLAFCAIFRNEARYLREWIEFHRLGGGERFYLYNNLSEDDYEDVLAPYVDAGIVQLRDWENQVFDRETLEQAGAPGQCAAYHDCIERHTQAARWVAFIDVDEFLFSPTLRPVSDVLREYEAFPGVGVNRLTYGTSGHELPAPGLVTESYTKRQTEEAADRAIKSVADPRRAVRCTGNGTHAHAFVYREGFAVNEDLRPIDRQPFGVNDPPTFNRLRINHYWMRSKQALRQKHQAPQSGNSGKAAGETYQEVDARCSAVTDETMRAFLPALKRALERPAEDLSTTLTRSV
jgi:hypothetical protein